MCLGEGQVAGSEILWKLSADILKKQMTGKDVPGLLTYFQRTCAMVTVLRTTIAFSLNE